mgnify:CR=1 FL=1
MAVKKVTKKKASAKLSKLEKEVLAQLKKWAYPQYKEVCANNGIPSE